MSDVEQRDIYFAARYGAQPWERVGYISEEGVSRTCAEWARAAEEVRAMRALATATDTPAVFMQDYTNIAHSSPRRTGKNALLDDIKSALATVEAAKQTVLCHPSLRARVEEQIEVEGLQHRVRVVQTPYIEQASMYVLSQHAVDFTKGCDCLIHPDRAMSEDGDPYGCYCECAEMDDPNCDHKRE